MWDLGLTSLYVWKSQNVSEHEQFYSFQLLILRQDLTLSNTQWRQTPSHIQSILLDYDLNQFLRLVGVGENKGGVGRDTS